MLSATLSLGGSLITWRRPRSLSVFTAERAVICPAEVDQLSCAKPNLTAAAQSFHSRRAGTREGIPGYCRLGSVSLRSIAICLVIVLQYTMGLSYARILHHIQDGTVRSYKSTSSWRGQLRDTSTSPGRLAAPRPTASVLQLQDRILTLQGAQNVLSPYSNGRGDRKELPAEKNRNALLAASGKQHAFRGLFDRIVETTMSSKDTFSSKKEKCVLTRKTKIVRIPNCDPVRVRISVCSGKCKSHSKPRTAVKLGGHWLRNHSNAFYSIVCRCCRAKAFVEKSFLAVCRSSNGQQRTRQITFQDPSGCECDRCSPDRAKVYL